MKTKPHKSTSKSKKLGIGHSLGQLVIRSIRNSHLTTPTPSTGSGRKAVTRTKSSWLSLSKTRSHSRFTIPTLALLLVVLILTPILYLRLRHPAPTDAWFDHTWTYRQRLTITNSGAAINASRKINLPIDTATLITDGKLQSDCADIRFTDTNGVILNHFIDTATSDCNTADTAFYIKLDSVLTGDQTIYLYYGNPSATTIQHNDFFADTTLGQGLVGYWPMEDNVSGDGQTILDYALSNHGTTNDANASGMDCTVSGQVGNACDFDGVDDYIDVGDPENGVLDMGTSDFSYSVWINTSDTAETRWILEKGVTSNTTPGYSLYIDDTGILLSRIGDGVTRLTKTWYGFDVEDEQWHYLIVTHDRGGLATLYVDNEVIDTWDISSLDGQSISTDSIFEISRIPGSKMDGSIDDVRIYSRALTATEISQIYNSGAGSTINVPLTFTPNSTSTASEETGPGPVLYLSFDEGQGTTAYDQSGKGNNGTITGATWQSEDKCISGKCLYFDGSGDYVQVGDNDTLDMGTSSYSISLWYRTGNGTDYMGLVNNGGATAGPGGLGYNLVMPNSWDPGTGKLSILQADGSYVEHSYYTNTSLFDNNWHQVTISYDSGNSLKLYVDGKFIHQDSNINTVDIDSPTSPFLIGAWGTGSGGFDGFIDEVRIYPYALTAAQVKADYTAKGGGVKGVTAYVNDDKYKSLNDGLVGYWPMEDNVSGNAQTIVDASGNGNNGTTNYGANTTGMDCTVSGKFGTACSFDGVDDFINPITTTDFTPGDGSLSGSMWVNPAASQSSNQTGLFKIEGPDYIMFELNTSNGMLFELRDQPSGTENRWSSATSTTLNTGEWNHLVYIFHRETSTFEFYLNGELIKSYELSGIDDSVDVTTATIGRHVGYFEGALDEVRIYNRALSPQEVQNLYEWAPGPVAHYAMDDGVQGAGQTIIDSSGNGNNGTTSSANGTGMDCTVQGQYGGACEFDGVDDTVILGDLDDFKTANKTIMFWANPPVGTLTSTRAIVGSSSANYYAGFALNKQMITSHYKSTNIQQTSYSGSNNAVEGEWHHYTYSWSIDGQNVVVKMYRDGVQIKQSNFTEGYSENYGTNFVLGSFANNSGFSNVALDDVRIYNYALTPKQIRNIMNARPVDATAIGSPLGSPIAHYTFDEGYGTTAYDSVGGYNGTFGGATNPAWVGGKFGKALDFTATTGNDGSRVSYTGDDLDIGTTTGDELTLSMWLKPDTSQTNPSAYFIRNGWGADENYGFLIRELSGGLYKIRMEYYDGAFRSITSTNRIVPAGEWSYLVIKIIQGTSVSYYVNGEFKETVSWTGNSSVSSNSTFNIGGHAGTTNQSYDGLIDDVKIYNYALTPDEIAQDYNQSSRLTLGTTSTESDGTTSSNSSDRSYCVPGDTATCDPPVFEMTFDQQKVSGAGQNIYDTSGNGNNGTTSSANGTGMNCSVAGKVGNACEFDGVDDKVATSTSTGFSSSAVSFSVWAKKSSNPSGWISVLRAGGQNGFFLNTLGDKLRFQLQFTNAGIVTVDGALDNEWHYWTGTWESGEKLRIYKDGVLVGSSGSHYTDTISGTITDFQIGYYATTGLYFTGLIDQVRIYDYARTPAQIAWEYNQGAPVAWYKFDECQGTTIYDWSENASGQSNGNHGTLNIGATGTQTSAGTCSSGTSTQAWNNGTTGKWGSAMSFDGTDDYVEIATSDIGLLEKSASVCMWVNRNTTGTAQRFFSARSGATLTRESFEIYIETGSNNIRLDLGDGTNVAALGSGTSDILGGSWYHICGIRDLENTKAKIYVNGQLDREATTAVTGDINPTQYRIGNFSSSYLNGSADDVRIYNYALTPAQVKLIYNDGAVNFR